MEIERVLVSRSLLFRSLGHRFGAGAAPFGSAVRTRVPRPPGFGLLPPRRLRVSEWHLLDHCGESHWYLQSCDDAFAPMAQGCFAVLFLGDRRNAKTCFQGEAYANHPTGLNMAASSAPFRMFIGQIEDNPQSKRPLVARGAFPMRRDARTLNNRFG
jgi:hypothetical protein